MSQALYRTYRPTTFDQVISQEHIKLTLQNQIKSQRIAHAYLFAGPRGVGKTTLARIFAKAINAEAIAKHTLQDTNLIDIIEIDAASHTGVDNVRENIIQNSYVAPAQITYKVFIIDEVHMLSASAFNALLKILEEPPAHVVFILATTEVHKLPATVISRCQRFDFHAIKLPEMVKRLQWLCAQEKVEVEPVVLERIARKAQGAVRDADSLLGQMLAAGDAKVTSALADVVLPRVDMAVAVELFAHLVERQPQAYAQGVEAAVQSGAQMKELWQLQLELFRRGLLYSIDQSLMHLEDLDVHLSTHERLISLMTKLSSHDYLQLLDLFMAAGELYQRSPITQLLIEVPGLEWCLSGHTTVIPTMVAPTPSKPASPAAPVAKPLAPKATAGKPPQPAAQATKQSTVSARETDQAMIDAVKQHWAEVMRRTKEVNHALAMALSVAHVAGAYAPNRVQFGFRYDFHRDRVCQLEHLRAIEGILAQLLGKDIIVECVVGDQYDIDVSVLNTLPSDNIAAVNPAEMDNVWDLALQTIGGKEVK
ncbi:MAG: DNA polymerase III subunit gamma/tau [Candidatus Kerfeldbacteria bacterium]|nr:DNA polymerase III subunit gamma/tau [Candidatus Kerfeldbacteria bacterium]